MLSVILAIGYGMLKIPVVAGKAIWKISSVLVAFVINLPLPLLLLPTMIRRLYNSNEPTSTWTWGQALGTLAAAPIIGNLPLFIATSDSPQTPLFWYTLMALVPTNLLSLCYEIGRKKTSEVEKPTAEAKAKPDDGVSDFMTMYDSIRGFDSLAPEQTRELYRRIVELTGERKITIDEAKKLCAIVENAARNIWRQNQGTGEYARE